MTGANDANESQCQWNNQIQSNCIPTYSMPGIVHVHRKSKTPRQTVPNSLKGWDKASTLHTLVSDPSQFSSPSSLLFLSIAKQNTIHATLKDKSILWQAHDLYTSLPLLLLFPFPFTVEVENQTSGIWASWCSSHSSLMNSCGGGAAPRLGLPHRPLLYQLLRNDSVIQQPFAEPSLPGHVWEKTHRWIPWELQAGVTSPSNFRMKIQGVKVSAD